MDSDHLEVSIKNILGDSWTTGRRRTAQGVAYARQEQDAHMAILG